MFYRNESYNGGKSYASCFRWIKHDLDALSDKKIRIAIHKHGLAIYGAFWALLEVLATERSHSLPLQDAVDFLDSLQPQGGRGLADGLAAAGLIQIDEQAAAIYSEALNRRLDADEKRGHRLSEAGRKGAEKTNSLRPGRSLAAATPRQLDIDKEEDKDIDKDLDINIKNKRDPSDRPPDDPPAPVTKIKLADRIFATEEERRKLLALCTDAGQTEEFLRSEIERASDWSLAKGRIHKNGAAFMRNWLKRALASNRRFGGNGRDPEFEKAMKHLKDNYGDSR